MRPVSLQGTADCREFYYARYVDWAFTTPLMLLEVAGIAGASWDVLLWLLGTDFVMIIAGLIGAFISTEEKWCVTHSLRLLPSVRTAHANSLPILLAGLSGALA